MSEAIHSHHPDGQKDDIKHGPGVTPRKEKGPGVGMPKASNKETIHSHSTKKGHKDDQTHGPGVK